MIRLALAAAAALALSGCGNLCDRIESQNASFETKHKACNTDGTASDPFNKATCNENLAKCTAADQEKINKYLDCADKIAACTPDTNMTFAGAVSDCISSSGVQGLSADCLNAL